jgi:5,10-methylenetetrahydromethanopterin reductase
MAQFPLEFWTEGKGFPGTTAPLARRAEEDGWDGLAVADSQNLTGDPYLALAMAAAVTSRIKLGPGVTNSLTRHPAVTATAIATLQEESGGRAVLGIGRGDSALAHIGLAPASVKSFTHYLTRVQGYLSGADVPFEVDVDGADARPAGTLNMSDTPTLSRLRWLKYASQLKVPVHAVASGPRVIKATATVCDGVIFAVGASVSRLKWAIGLAREARTEAGLDPDTLQLGAMVPIAPHPDAQRARHLIAPTLGSYVRFSVMHGTINGPATDGQRESMTAVHRLYDMNTHVRPGPQSQAITDEVIDTFAIAGTPEDCGDRLTELADLGITKFLTIRGDTANLKDSDAEGRQQAYHHLIGTAVPRARAHRPAPVQA